MGDEGTKRAAQEYLAAKLSEEGQSYEDKLNPIWIIWKLRLRLLLQCGKMIADTIIAK